MAQPAQNDQAVVDMVGYLRDTLRELDESIAEMQHRRHGLAVRLAVIEAASSAEVVAAADEYNQRAEEGRPYETSRPSEDVVAEAHRRYGR